MAGFAWHSFLYKLKNVFYHLLMERHTTTTTVRSHTSSINPATAKLLGQYFDRKHIPFIFLIDTDLNIHYTNVSKERPFFGSSVSEPSSLKELVDPKSQLLISSTVEKMLQGVAKSQLHQVPLEVPNAPRTDLYFEPFDAVELSGDRELVELSIRLSAVEEATSPLVTELNELREDHHQLLQSVERLNRTNEYLDRFVSGAAHDLRGPLVVLKSYVDLIRRFDKEEKRLEALDHMKTATIRFETVVSGLVESVEFKKKGECNAEQLDLQKAYDMAMFQLSTERELLRPEMTTDFSLLPQVYFIKSYLNSILYNLISNAFKYRCEERPLKMKLNSYQEGEFVVLSVEDNGIGIDLKRYSAQLFQPFQRLTNQAEGIGIGLSLINQMVEENGGFIRVESTLGEGCCFKVFLRPYS